MKRYHGLSRKVTTMLGLHPEPENAVDFLEDQRKSTLDFVDNQGSPELLEAIYLWEEILSDDFRKSAKTLNQSVSRFSIILILCHAYDHDNCKEFVEGMAGQERLRDQFDLKE